MQGLNQCIDFIISATTPNCQILQAVWNLHVCMNLEPSIQVLLLICHKRALQSVPSIFYSLRSIDIFMWRVILSKSPWSHIFSKLITISYKDYEQQNQYMTLYISLITPLHCQVYTSQCFLTATSRSIEGRHVWTRQTIIEEKHLHMLFSPGTTKDIRYVTVRDLYSLRETEET